jgi:hypothetical protein
MIAGDLRRGCEVISDLRLVATSKAISMRVHERLGAVGVDISPPANHGSTLLYATGSAKHLASRSPVATIAVPPRLSSRATAAAKKSSGLKARGFGAGEAAGRH